MVCGVSWLGRLRHMRFLWKGMALVIAVLQQSPSSLAGRFELSTSYMACLAAVDPGPDDMLEESGMSSLHLPLCSRIA